MASVPNGTKDADAPAAIDRQGRHPLLVTMASWLVPGAGHYLLGRHFRAVAYFGIVLLLFSVGIALDGRLDRPDRSSPLSYFKTAADIGVGPIYFVFTLTTPKNAAYPDGEVPPGIGDPTSSTYEHGTTFLLTAGILGWLLLIDAWDTATGRKRSGGAES